MICGLSLTGIMMTNLEYAQAIEDEWYKGYEDEA